MNEIQLTTFYLVRHGETDWNSQNKIHGQKDIPLNNKGERQADDLAKELKKVAFDLAFSSDLLRAKRTAEIIALEHKLQVQTTRLLRERYFAELEGEHPKLLRTYDEMLDKLSEKSRLQYRITDKSENDDEFISRLLVFLRETAITHPGKKILVATHGGVIRILLIHLGEFTYQSIRNYRIANTGYIVLNSDGVDFFVKEKHGIEQIKPNVSVAQ